MPHSARPPAAEQLLHEYVAAGGSAPHQWFHDLVAVVNAFGGCRYWAEPMRETGIADAYEPTLHDRLRPFALQVIDAVPTRHRTRPGVGVG